MIVSKLARVRVVVSNNEECMSVNSFWPEEVARMWHEPEGVFVELKNNSVMRLDHPYDEAEEIINQAKLGIRSSIELDNCDKK